MATSAAFAIGLVTQAHAVTWTFLENGQGSLGSSTATFWESGIGLTAHGYTSAGAAATLFAKNDGVGEMGLGLVSDIGNDHEIDLGHFVQIDSHISQGSLTTLFLGSVQGTGERAAVFGSNAWGTLGTQIGWRDSNGNIDVSSFLGSYQYFSVTTIGANWDANVLLGSVSATVPDNATTSLLLGLGLISLVIARRKR